MDLQLKVLLTKKAHINSGGKGGGVCTEREFLYKNLNRINKWLLKINYLLIFKIIKVMFNVRTKFRIITKINFFNKKNCKIHEYSWLY